ncbi:MAG: hypothetical protein ACI85F_000433 [Bacteroidia bacterium]|jgi:hypothetical protein
MGKMQEVNFHDVEEFLEYLPKNERDIVDRLRSLVLECLPNCKEKLAYNVPFYYRNKRICYIWPPSVIWGNSNMEGVEFGFCYGHLLNDELGFLEKGSRKQIFFKKIMTLSDIDEDIMKAYLFMASDADDSMKKS